MGAYPGTYVGAPTLGVAGLLTGDADTAVAFGDRTPQKMTCSGLPESVDDWTFAFWVARAAAGTLDRFLDGGTGALAVLWEADNRMGISPSGSGYVWRSTAAYTDLGAHFWVFAKSGATTAVYYDGLPIAGSGVDAPIKLATTGTVRRFGGLIGTLDDSAVWDRALTAAEVAALYAAGRVAPTVVGNTITAGALPVVTPVSGAAFRPTDTRDVHLVVPVTYNPSAVATATCTVEVSPDNSTFTTVTTKTYPMLATLAGLVETVELGIPMGWWVKLTVVNATLGTGTYW
jgi:phage-related protein